VTDRPPPDPVLASLLGAHAHLSEAKGRAIRYHPEVAGFTTVQGERDAEAWRDLAALVGPGQQVSLSDPPPDWEVEWVGEGVQLIAVALDTTPDPQARVLGPADVPEMLDLVARTEPGPFRNRTIEMGTYLGIHDNGTLIAMAANAYAHRAGPKSARSAQTRNTEAKAWPPAWSAQWPTAS